MYGYRKQIIQSKFILFYVCSSSNAPSKEIEAKAFSQMYSDEKARADQLHLEVGRLNKEVEGLKKEWQDAR